MSSIGLCFPTNSAWKLKTPGGILKYHRCSFMFGQMGTRPILPSQGFFVFLYKVNGVVENIYTHLFQSITITLLHCMDWPGLCDAPTLWLHSVALASMRWRNLKTHLQGHRTEHVIELKFTIIKDPYIYKISLTALCLADPGKARCCSTNTVVIE